jgi:hypothetical protein
VASRVSLFVVYVCATGAVVGAQTVDRPAVRLVLTFQSTSDTLPDAIRANALEEAARLWLPYGVLVTDGGSAGCDLFAPSVPIDVTVDAGDESPDRSDNGLGSVRFAADGSPDPAIVMHYDAITRLAVTTRPFGVDAGAWPVKLHDQVVGRAFGRALAHELGHYLLRWSHHEAQGLMRAVLHASTLTEADADGLGLTPVDVARLDIVVAAGKLRGVGSVRAIDAALRMPESCVAATH